MNDQPHWAAVKVRALLLYWEENPLTAGDPAPNPFKARDHAFGAGWDAALAEMRARIKRMFPGGDDEL